MGSAITYALFVETWPNFATAKAERKAQIVRELGYAELEIHRDAWGAEKADLAVKHLCAHALLMHDRNTKHGGDGAGPISARTVGPNVVGFNSTLQSGPDDVYRSTTAGMLYLRLRQSLLLTPGVVT